MSIASLGHTNVNAVIADLLKMDNAQRQQFAQHHADDPLMLSAAKFVDNKIKEQAQAYLAQQSGSAPPKVNEQVVQQMGPQTPQPQAQPQGQPQPQPQPQGQPQAAATLPENSGIAQLPAQNIQKMAGGGIVAFAGDAGSLTKLDPFSTALDLENITDPRQVAYLKSIYGQESTSGKNAVTSNRGAVGGMQIKPGTFGDVADPGMNIKNPVDNARAGIRYALQGYQLANGNPELAATYYYGGPEGFKAALKGKAVSDPVNPKAPNTLGYGKEVADRMTKLLPIGSAQASEVKPASKSGLASLPSSQEVDLSGPMEFSVPQGSGTAPTPNKAPAAATPAAPTEPWYDRYRKALTSGEGQRQMLLGVGDLPYNLVGAPADIGSAISKSLGYKGGESYLGSKNLKRLGTEYLGREADSTDPTLRGMREVGELGSLAIDPFATTKRIAQGAQGLQDLASTSRATAAQAEGTTSRLRLEPPRAEPPVMVAGPQGGVMPADSLRRVEQALSDEARAANLATIAGHNERAARMAPNAEQRAAMLGRAGMYDTARGTVGAAKVGNAADSALAQGFTPPTPTPTITGKDQGAYLPDGLPAYTAGSLTAEDLAKERGANLPDRPTPAEPEKTQKSGFGFTNEDIVRLGLAMMAGKSQYAMENIANAGLATLDAKREREKQEAVLAQQARQNALEEKKQAMMEKYYGPLGEQALANAEYIKSEKGQDALKMKALTLAETEYAKWASDPMGGGLADAATKAAYRQNIFNDYLSRMGVTGTGGTMAKVPTALEFVGSRPD